MQIYGSITAKVSGTGHSLIGISNSKAWPKADVVGFCGGYDRVCGDVRINTKGEIIFNLPVANAGYAFNISYNTLK
ncbi:MAG TPA: hypothetical protein DDY31_17685 [Lachnospiraceae bacterium]|nr:hypothetical protein [Lachnospiraceae bacterium]